MPPPLTDEDRSRHRALAVSLFNRVWELLDQADRTQDDIDEMIHAAHASRHHWGVAGSVENWLVGEWQVSRVYAVLGRFEPALFHAQRALSLADGAAVTGFNRGICYEALARAWSLTDPQQSREFLEAARGICRALTDADERQVLESDLNALEPTEKP